MVIDIIHGARNTLNAARHLEINMKLIIAVLLLAVSFSSFASTLSGKLQRSNPEQTGIPPNGEVIYDRDCAGAGKPKNMHTTIVSAVSGVGTIVTLTETDTVNTWVSTVDTSVANTTVASCAQLQ